MKFRHLSALIAFAVAASPVAASPVKVPVVQTGSGYQPAQGSVQIDSAGNDATDTANHAVRVNVVAGGSGGGGSNAAASATGAAVPTSADYVGFNSAGNLIGVSSANPLPVTGAITNTAFGISGTLPAFASTPTVNIGTAPTIAVTGAFYQATQPISAANLPLPTGAATAAGLTTINTTLGTPFQAGGSIGNTAFAATLGTTNGWTPKLANGLTTTVLSVKSSAGQISTLQCYNPNSTQAYVQIFNIASGSVTLGTSTPALSIPIAPTSTGGLALANPGINFSTAISIAATTTATGSTAPSTALDCNVVFN